MKDEDVAIKMTKYIELNSIGVSRESQHRAAKILGAVSDSSQCIGANFFQYGKSLMAERWTKFREVISRSRLFSLPKYMEEYCQFSGEDTEPHPGNALYNLIICIQLGIPQKAYNKHIIFPPLNSLCMVEVQQ